MNPWIAHLENQDLKWIVDSGRGVYFDPGIDILFPNPTLILDGELECRGHLRGSGGHCSEFQNGTSKPKKVHFGR